MATASQRVHEPDDDEKRLAELGYKTGTQAEMERVLQLRHLVQHHLDPGRLFHHVRPGLEQRWTVIGLYVAFLVPILLRLRMGDRFVPGPWTLGPKYKVIGWIAAIEIIVVSIYFVLPFSPAGIPGNADFDWKAVNYAPIALLIVVAGVAALWFANGRKHFTGMRRNVDEPAQR